MIIWTFRFLRRKWREHQAAKEHPSSDPDLGSPQPLDHTAPSDSPPPAVVNPSPGAQSSKQNIKWTIMLMGALAIPVFLETLDYTVVATAQVHIASVFNRLDLQSYIGTIYLLTSTVFLPSFASIADVFGRQIALQLSLLFFLVGSAISTGAMNMPTMLAGRGVAGVGAAGLLAVVRIILSDSGSLDQNNWQQTLMFILYTIGYCLGPYIGGALVTVSFRWIFAINLPCAAIAMVLGFFLLHGRIKGSLPSSRLPTSATPQTRMEKFTEKLFRIDWIGTLLFMGAGLPILLALNWGSTEEWNAAKVIACFVVGGVLFVACIAWEYVLESRGGDISSGNVSDSRLFYANPLIPLSLFKSLNICVVLYGTYVTGMVMLVMFYFVAIFFVIVTGLSPQRSGAQLIYFAPGMGGGALISIQLIKSIRQPKYPIILGTAICTVALGLISMGMQKNKENWVNGFMVMAGAGVGLSMGPLAVQARFSQPAERNAVVSALLLFARSLGGTVGLAQCGAVLNAKVSNHISNLIRSGALSPSDAAQLAQTSSSSSLESLSSIDSLPDALQTVVRDAFREGTRYAFISLIPWCGLAVVLALFLHHITDSDRQMREEEKERPKSEVRVDGTKSEMSTPQIR